MKNWEERCHVLEAENEMLREQVEHLKKSLGAEIEIPMVFGLTKQEAVIFGCLMKMKACTKENLYNALYGITLTESEVEIKIIDVFVCKMRPKLKSFGISIDTVWGQGYSMGAESKKKAQELIDQIGAAFLPEEGENASNAVA